METQLDITLFFVGLFALIQVPLTMAVGFRRAQTNISFLDGGDSVLLRRMRAHANYVENVPMCLLVLAAAEFSGITSWAIWSAGLCILAGRCLHIYALLMKANPIYRALGMLMTLIPMGILGVTVILKNLPTFS